MQSPLAAVLVKDNSHFTASATFKLTGLRTVFEDDSELREGDNILRHALPCFGHGLSFVVIINLSAEPAPDQEGHFPARKQNRLVVYLHPPTTAFPLKVHASLEISSLLSQKIYANSWFDWTYTAENHRGRGWKSRLNPQLWRRYESMRSDDGVLLRIHIQSPPGPNISSPALYTVVHKTICGDSSPDIRFTVFNRRDASGQLGGRRVLLADGKVLRDSCKVLRQGLFFMEIANHELTVLPTVLFRDDRNGRWNGIDVNAPPEDDPRTTYDDLDSDFEEEDDIVRDNESELTPLDDDSLDGEPVAKRSRPARDSGVDANENSEDAAAETLCDVRSIKQERRDTPMSSDGRHAENASDGASKSSILRSVSRLIQLALR